jgi:hypothetical protein
MAAMTTARGAVGGVAGGAAGGAAAITVKAIHAIKRRQQNRAATAKTATAATVANEDEDETKMNAAASRRPPAMNATISNPTILKKSRQSRLRVAFHSPPTTPIFPTGMCHPGKI